MDDVADAACPQLVEQLARGAERFARRAGIEVPLQTIHTSLCQQCDVLVDLTLDERRELRETGLRLARNASPALPSRSSPPSTASSSSRILAARGSSSMFMSIRSDWPAFDGTRRVNFTVLAIADAPSPANVMTLNFWTPSCGLSVAWPSRALYGRQHCQR